MPAPRNPSTAAASAARVRQGQETMARKLREAGWTVTRTFTVEIQATADGEVWQAMHPAENVDGESAREVARFVASNQTVADGAFRVMVWDGADADTVRGQAAYTLRYHDDEWRA